ncbi:hydantoinase/oxoprolinase family protein [Poseidonocella sp. HB161398]|uniref:hydantoinase/oxoprolinase family protein n=1 Tax=Poseidonocella sp. HB161398 TaxID=2320855 RepID=UPI00110939FC|nr:hydantoinase/oxoprolinase family protein [Poseidonocella sp. HB161398]
MYRISVDTGGTFTDVVVTDGQGRLTVGKALTTPERSFTGLSDSIANAAEQIGIPLGQLLAETRVMVYGTTRATNAIVERKTAKTALLVTEGFPDVLVFRKGGKLNALEINAPVEPPYIPRALTFEIPERMNAEGGVETALDEAAARAVLEKLGRIGIEAVAVSLLWSIANSAHERRLGQLIEEILPGVPYTLSSALNPTIREYPRSSSAAIDASLKPLMQTHLRDLKADLAAAGFGGELLISASSGGVMHIDDVVQKPVYMAKSGPAMAPLAGIAYTRAEEFGNDVIIVDTGGTTFDVSLIRDGAIKYTRETWLGTPMASTMLGMATVDIRSVGAGGGSIAWVDDGGMLRVGPHSAGSVPGPACYGKGGLRPTVTDAAVVLGYIDPDRFLGGRMKLDRAAAETAMQGVAVQLGKTIWETASAILRISSETMIKAIEDITTNDGVSPSDSTIVAGGGAAGLNVLSIARAMKAKNVVIPKTAGAISAAGGQFSDIAIDFSASCYGASDAFDSAAVREALGGLAAQSAEFEAALRAKGVDTFRRQLFVEARYARQQWELEVELPVDWAQEAADVELLETLFAQQYQRLYHVNRKGTVVEAINWRLRVAAILPSPQVSWEGPSETVPGERENRAYFDGAGHIATRVLDGTTLPLGCEIAGPAIIEEPTTTIVVDPGMTGRLSHSGNYIFEFGGNHG